MRISDIQKELERHLSSYSPDAIVVNQESTLKKDLEKFFGKEPEKKEKKNQSSKQTNSLVWSSSSSNSNLPSYKALSRRSLR